MKSKWDDAFTMTFRPLESDVPASMRVREMLKYALRHLDLRCLGYRGADEADVLRETEPADDGIL